MLLVKSNQLLCCQNVGVDRFIEELLIYKLDRNSFHLHLRQFSEKSTMSLYGKFLGQLRSQTRADTRAPGEYFQIRRSGGGGVGPHIKFGGNIWDKVRPSSPNERKNLGSSVPTRQKSWEKVSVLGVISEIQRAKFGVFVTYIFGGKIWGSNKNFRGRCLSQAPPTS